MTGIRPKQVLRKWVLPNRRIWFKQLSRRFGTGEAAAILKHARELYIELRRAQRPLSNRVLQRHLFQVILPGLVLYRALDTAIPDQEKRLQDMETLLTLPLEKTVKISSILKLVPHPFNLFRRALRLRMRDFPKEGWIMEPVEDSDQSIAFNARRCFFLEMLSSCGAAELTPAFCATDDAVVRAFPRSIRFERSQTLAKGADCCDFVYRNLDYKA